MGFNAIQLNIAWSYRPADEPLNLEDVINVDGSPQPLADLDRTQRRREDLRERSDLAREHGLRTMFHFGAPFQGREGYEGGALPQCVLDPATTARYVAGVAELASSYPNIDDLLVYTFDQDAWLCSEFGRCERCSGVPLHERVTPFVNAIGAAWSAVRPQGRTWWEPWELSAGQTFASIPLLDASVVGLMLHNSIAEVISTMPADRFLRNAIAMARGHGIPVIAEVFLSSSNEEVEPWYRLPVPLVTVRQLRALERLDGLGGVKEYFGIVPSAYDVNAAAAGAYFADPEVEDAAALGVAAEAFGSAATWLPEFWRITSHAYELYPWDATWFARQLGRSQPLHELSAATIRGMQADAAVWETPAWRSSRGSVFMQTDTREPHQWALEDVALRFRAAAHHMTRALTLFDAHFQDGQGEVSIELARQRSEVEGFITRTTAYYLHIRQTNIATLLRGRQLSPARHAALRTELVALLDADLRNQQRELARAAASPHIQDEEPLALQVRERWIVPTRTDLSPLTEAIALLKQDLDEFLRVYLLPVPDRASAGQFSMTSR